MAPVNAPSRLKKPCCTDLILTSCLVQSGVECLLHSQEPVSPGAAPSAMWSRMKALCQNCWVSKHSPGSSTYTFCPLWCPFFGRKAEVCLMCGAWQSFIPLSCRTCPMQATAPPPACQSKQLKTNLRITGCYSPSTRLLQGALSADFCHPAAAQNISQSPSVPPFPSHRMCRHVRWSHRTCAFDFFTLRPD